MTKDDLIADWKATYGELFPYREPDRMNIDDATLALGILLYRRIEIMLKTRVIEPAYARDYRPEIKYDLEE